MAVRLSERAFEQAKSVVVDGRFVDDRDDWSDCRPSAVAHLRGMVDALHAAGRVDR
jgi:hypothetical protein